MRRRPCLFAAALVLTWAAVPILAQSSPSAATSDAQQPVEPPAASGPAQGPDQQPPDNTPPAQTPDQTKPTDPGTAKAPNQGRPAAQTPGVRTGTVTVSDTVTVGGYGSLRYEANNLE